jgi:mannitol-specific phosphotransferase system IIBC component
MDGESMAGIADDLIAESSEVISQYNEFIRVLTLKLWLNTVSACILAAISVSSIAYLLFSQSKTSSMLAIIGFAASAFATASIAAYIMKLRGVKKQAQHTLQAQQIAQDNIVTQKNSVHGWS